MKNYFLLMDCLIVSAHGLYLKKLEVLKREKKGGGRGRMNAIAIYHCPNVRGNRRFFTTHFILSKALYMQMQSVILAKELY